MEYAITIVIGSLVSWLILLIVVPISQKLADFAFPPWGEALWKLALVALACTAVETGLGPIHWLLAWVVSAILFWVLMVKWFQIDFFGAVIIVIVSWVTQRAIMLVLLATLQSISG